jgi:hypothetical protein
LTCNDISTEKEKKPKREGNRNTKQQKKKNTCNIVTWNVRSVYEGKLNIVQKEINRMDTDILGISEMKWIGSGHFRSANNSVVIGTQYPKKEWRGNDHNKPNVSVTYRLQASKRQNHIYKNEGTPGKQLAYRSTLLQPAWKQQTQKSSTETYARL